MIVQLALLSIPLAFVYGWFCAKRSIDVQDNKMDKTLREVYFQGLNYLIDEQPDRAVDVFIHLVDIDADTVETHMTLGNLFRRRGEFDRAIKVHQSLIARPQLSRLCRLQALFSLAQDYYSAGVLDRSERILLDLIKCGGEDKSILNLLLRIYEQERDWCKAIQFSKRLQGLGSPTSCVATAHYYCQLAEERIHQVQYAEAADYLQQAIAIDENCIRAYFLRAQVECGRHQYAAAIGDYQKVELLDFEYVFFVLKEYCYCYAQLGSQHEIKNLFVRCAEYSPEFYLCAIFDGDFLKYQSSWVAVELLLRSLEKRSSLLTVDCLLARYIEGLNEQCDRDSLLVLQTIMRSTLAEMWGYQCQGCGFSGHSFLWNCPACHRWSTFRVKLFF